MVLNLCITEEQLGTLLDNIWKNRTSNSSSEHNAEWPYLSYIYWWAIALIFTAKMKWSFNLFYSLEQIWMQFSKSGVETDLCAWGCKHWLMGVSVWHGLYSEEAVFGVSLGIVVWWELIFHITAKVQPYQLQISSVDKYICKCLHSLAFVNVSTHKKCTFSRALLYSYSGLVSWNRMVTNLGNNRGLIPEASDLTTTAQLPIGCSKHFVCSAFHFHFSFIFHSLRSFDV